MEYNDLGEMFDDIAMAIQEKEVSTDTIVAEDFAERIRGLTVGGGLEFKTVELPPSLAGEGYWYDITYGDGKYIAINSDGSVALSTDGITWSITNAFNDAVSSFRCSITYGNGKYVGSWKKGGVAYSTDGITWTPLKSLDDQWDVLEYSNGQFFLITQSGYLFAHSTDAINWSTQTDVIPLTAIQAFVYDKGKYVIASQDGTIASSTDLVNWKQVSNAGMFWGASTYGNGKFIVVGAAPVATYSTDGENWLTSPLPLAAWSSVVYGNGKYVAINNAEMYKAETVAAYSTDGITWLSIPSFSNDLPWMSMVYGNGKFVAISMDGKIAIAEA